MGCSIQLTTLGSLGKILKRGLKETKLLCGHVELFSLPTAYAQLAQGPPSPLFRFSPPTGLSLIIDNDTSIIHVSYYRAVINMMDSWYHRQSTDSSYIIHYLTRTTRLAV